ncbi:MAG: thermostable hemolysin [Alphaproteobacteria bacterium]|nr:thermostable hemolysin [Alphaproteobacteria bacterium]
MTGRHAFSTKLEVVVADGKASATKPQTVLRRQPNNAVRCKQVFHTQACADAFSFAKVHFNQAFSAHLTAPASRYVVATSGSDRIVGVIAVRPTRGSGECLSERYLGMPVEAWMALHRDERLTNDDIVEGGSLAVEHPGIVEPLLRFAAASAYAEGYKYLLLTATRTVRLVFRRLGFIVDELCVASPSVLSAEEIGAWGSYYDRRHAPKVCLLIVEQMFAVVAPQMRRQLQQGNDVDLASDGWTVDTTLTYSAGSRSRDPSKYRIVTPIEGLLSSIMQHAPDLIDIVEKAPPLVIQVYPATLDVRKVGPRLDTYCHIPTAIRALQLAVHRSRAALFCTTPLLAARVLLEYAERHSSFPPHMLMAVGGYPLPLSLERTLQNLVRERGSTFDVVQFFGQAEIDAACLFSLKRDPSGRPLYHPRLGVALTKSNGVVEVRLSAQGKSVTFDDEITPGPDGALIENASRWTPEVMSELEGWSDGEWRRRTGFLHMRPNETVFQLREGEEKKGAQEMEFYDYSRRFRMNWLEKPDWSYDRECCVPAKV